MEDPPNAASLIQQFCEATESQENVVGLELDFGILSDHSLGTTIPGSKLVGLDDSCK